MRCWPPGDRLVAARSLFGSCFVVCDEILPRWGVETVFVDGEDLAQWEEALSVPTQAVFFETPSNPMQSLVDIAAVCEMAHARAQKWCWTTSSPPRSCSRAFRSAPTSWCTRAPSTSTVRAGCSAVRSWATRTYIDGPVQKLMRHTGPALSAFNAWMLFKGLETLAVRVDYSNASAQRIAEFLENHPP